MGEVCASRNVWTHDCLQCLLTSCICPSINCASSLCLHCWIFTLHSRLILRQVQHCTFIHVEQRTLRPSELPLPAMLSSPDQEKRTEVVEVICIQNEAMIDTLLPWKFQVPRLNFKADQLHELIAWDSVALGSAKLQPFSSLTMCWLAWHRNFTSRLRVTATQSVECAIGKVSGASFLAVGQQNRDGWIRCSTASSQKLRN